MLEGASRQIILASVMVGKHILIEPNPALRHPPVIEGRKSQKYDSVLGNLGDSNCFVIYSNEKRAYPMYLITYQ